MSFGPRLYVMGVRLHECYVGLALLALAAVALLPRIGYPSHVAGLLTVLGAWLVIKDWRDFFPARRDTAPWRVGVHRPHLELREVRRGDWLPPALGALAALAGAVNVASALSPEITERVAVLTQVAPARMVPIATALALPAGAALLIAGCYLAARRRHAWALATTLLIVLGVLNLMKGLDVEEALLSWSLAGLLIWGREAFYVRHPAGSLAAAARQVPLVLGTAFGVALVTLWATRARMTPDLTWGRAVREAAGLLTLTGGPLHLRDGAHWVPAGLGILGVGAMAMAAALVFRPLAAPSRAPGAGGRARARRLVLAHGHDTLSFFKLRGDVRYVFSPDGRAFLAYRIEAGVMLVSGDPVGDAAAVPGLLRRVRTLAETHGLRLALLAGSDGVLDVARQAGLRSLYIGDEAIVDVAGFSLEGRPIRKVRQSVTRLERAGYRLSLDRQGDLPPGAVAELQARLRPLARRPARARIRHGPGPARRRRPGRLPRRRGPRRVRGGAGVPAAGPVLRPPGGVAEPHAP